MNICQNCGSHVTDRALRVLYPENVETPKRCIKCSERRKGEFVEARSKGGLRADSR